ncbi:MAG: TonB-dependent receptor plug domain-containing protein [Opitutaceae bacterium]|nr:TonB-dependent receptor plug domain-containing protein [Opitutaceae bacterium]
MNTRLNPVFFCALATTMALVAALPLRAQTSLPHAASVSAATLARYDKNGNGQLDPGEMAAMQADQGQQSGVVLLNPFEVSTDKDTSYGAVNSNSISAFNMPLLKAPVAADIFTEQFMQDVATTSVEELLNNYGAGVGQVLATPDSDSNNNQPGDRFSVAQVGSRGLTAGVTRRDGFIASSTRTSINDTFDTERVEVIKGANALLYGASGAGGFANTQSKRAKFGSDGRPNRAGSGSLRIDQYGSKRWEFDANYGLKNVAVRFVALSEDQSYRRLFISSKTDAYYAAFAARLPFNTTLRVTGRKADNDRIISTRGDSLSFGNATRDPRHNYSLLYLLATDQAGATNPRTGQPYPAGPIVNGRLSYDNASSWSGWTQSEDIASETYTGSVETVWTRWLATSFGAIYDLSVNQRGPDGGSLLAPRAFNTSNPLETWANSSSFRMDRNAGKRRAYRANAVITNELFNGKASSQTVIGYDYNFSSGGNVNYRYYEADANFQLYDLSNPRPAAAGGTTGTNQLGRAELPTVYWSVQDGPIKKPGFRIGTRQITMNGKNYVLLQQNVRNPNFASANNPLGLVSLVPGFTGVGGANVGNYAEENDNSGVYLANYTRWLNERLTTLMGYRMSKTWSLRPNTNATGTQPWTEVEKDNHSYNLGLNYRFKPWLYGYYNIGQTFDPAKGSNDPYGNAPKDTEGFSQEIGFKYELMGGRFSGSVAYYRAESKNENFNYGTGNRDIINPVGINDAYNPSQRNQWVSLDKKSSGLEVILTAAPTKNWRSRLGFTQQDGKILTASSFPLLWNDEFHYNRTTGGVTYADGTPFLVPTDPAGITAVNQTSALRTAVVGATNTQLTVGMMSDRTNPYYAYGTGSTQQVNGRITNNSTVFRALRWFQTASGQQARTLRAGVPVSEIPYAYDDPAHLDGVLVLSESGEPTIGHPLYRFVFTNSYDFSEGVMKGVTIGGTIRWDIDKRTYWYQEPGDGGGNVRKLYQEVDINPQVSPFISYRRKIGRYLYSTQLNVNNAFNRYNVDLRPSATTGFTREEDIGATFVGEPRQYVWTNRISF